MAATHAQPVANHFLGMHPDVSNGKNFRSITEISEVILKGYAPVPHKTVKEFNSAGLITKQTSFNSAGGVGSETLWEYTTNLKLSRKHHRFFVNIAGWNEEEVTIEWDEEWKNPARIEIQKSGKLHQWATPSIDTLGTIETIQVFGPTGAHIFTERFNYIERSNMIRVMVYRATGQYVSSWSYPLDPSKPFNFESVSTQRYPNGLVRLEKLSMAGKGDQAYYYEYEYDNQKNWVEKRTYQVTLGKNDRIKKKKLENRITRTILYQ